MWSARHHTLTSVWLRVSQLENASRSSIHSDYQRGSLSMQTASPPLDSPPYSTIDVAIDLDGGLSKPTSREEATPPPAPTASAPGGLPDESLLPPSPSTSPPSEECSSVGPSKVWLRGRAKLQERHGVLATAPITRLWDTFR